MGPVVPDVLRSPGQPLDEAVRAFMEPRFGHDLSRVRVHRDDPAARSAEALGVRAYTVRNDVVFADGQYQPGTAYGDRLLAHELAHTIQQDEGATHAPGPIGPTDMEGEADRAASQALRGETRPSVSRFQPQLAMSPETPGQEPEKAAAGGQLCHGGQPCTLPDSLREKLAVQHDTVPDPGHEPCTVGQPCPGASFEEKLMKGYRMTYAEQEFLAEEKLALKKKAASKAYFDGVRERLDETAARISHKFKNIPEKQPHIAQAFAVYHLILDEIAEAASSGRKLDLNGLWDMAQKFDWDWKHTSWMQIGNQGDQFYNRGPLVPGEEVAGVDIHEVFKVVTGLEKPDPSQFERFLGRLELPKIILVFGTGFSGEVEAAALGGLERAAAKRAIIAARPLAPIVFETESVPLMEVAWLRRPEALPTPELFSTRSLVEAPPAPLAPVAPEGWPFSVPPAPEFSPTSSLSDAPAAPVVTTANKPASPVTPRTPVRINVSESIGKTAPVVKPASAPDIAGLERYGPISPAERRIEILAKKEIYVGVQAKITVTGAPAEEGLGARFSQFDEARAQAMGGTGSAAVLPEVPLPPKSPAKLGSQKSAGLIIQPTPGARELEVVAWNTGDPLYLSNVSHAEEQFIYWFKNQPKTWTDRVETLDVNVYGREICENCAGSIKQLKTAYPHIKFNWVRSDTGRMLKPPPPPKPVSGTE